jgi:predicted kinase
VEGLGAGLSTPLLLLVNGPPAIGKSTLARRWVDDHPLALVVDIDELRVRMGRWDAHPESKQLARSLAVALVRSHLASGHDVVVPQLLGRPDFIETLEVVASEEGAAFVEVLLRAPAEVVLARLARRRAELRTPHPQDEIDPALDGEILATTMTSLDRIASTRPQTMVVDATADDPTTVYAELLRLTRSARPPAAPSG